MRITRYLRKPPTTTTHTQERIRIGEKTDVKANRYFRKHKNILKFDLDNDIEYTKENTVLIKDLLGTQDISKN